MAGGSPQHHLDWMGYRVGDCSVAVVLAFERSELSSSEARLNRPAMSKHGPTPS